MISKGKGMTLIALFTAILVVVAGCKTSRERQAFPRGTGSSTTLPISTFDKSASDCYITIMGYGGVEVHITDPESRYLGIALDSETVVNEIPDADYQIDPTWGYDSSQGDSTAQPVKLVIAHIPDPVEGLYLLQVHGTLDTQRGGLSVSARCSGRAETMRMVNIEHGQELPLEYQFTYSLKNQELVTELAVGGQ